MSKDCTVYSFATYGQEVIFPQYESQKSCSIIDIWLDYKEKPDSGMIQQAIADALEVSRKDAGFKVQFAGLSNAVIEKFGTSDNLKESHARELLALVHCTKILNNEDAILEIITNVLSRKKEPTAKDFRQEVQKYNDFFKAYSNAISHLEYAYHDSFIQYLQDKQVRTVGQVNSIATRYREKRNHDAELLLQINQVEKARIESEKKAVKGWALFVAGRE